MCCCFEKSSLYDQTAEATPTGLMCACCLSGGGKPPVSSLAEIQSLLDSIRRNPDIHVTLKTAFDEAGARTGLFEKMTPQERKRDLDILREMGETPETVKTARAWVELLEEYIPTQKPICGDLRESGAWKNCPLAGERFYADGLRTLCPARGEEEMAQAKEASCRALDDAPMLCVRIHHLLCTICFVGGDHSDAPLAEDNLYELWERIKSEPQIPIRLIEGPGDCIICPPCYAFDPERGLCVISSSLRDRKKDLDVFSRLSLEPGTTLPARDVLAAIYQNIENVNGICRFDSRRGFEWRNCRTHEWGAFERGMEIVAKTLSLNR